MEEMRDLKVMMGFVQLVLLVWTEMVEHKVMMEELGMNWRAGEQSLVLIPEEFEIYFATYNEDNLRRVTQTCIFCSCLTF